jgi:7-keto-8-aminopelargonate synthetase-like enzyme
LTRKILPTYVEYPGGPEQGYFRFAISSEHTPAQLEDLLQALMTD